MEVYQSDFNAERQAREKIAGEKADLLEDIRRLKNSQPNISQTVNEVRLKIPSLNMLLPNNINKWQNKLLVLMHIADIFTLGIWTK